MLMRILLGRRSPPLALCPGQCLRSVEVLAGHFAHQLQPVSKLHRQIITQLLLMYGFVSQASMQCYSLQKAQPCTTSLRRQRTMQACMYFLKQRRRHIVIDNRERPCHPQEGILWNRNSVAWKHGVHLRASSISCTSSALSEPSCPIRVSPLKKRPQKPTVPVDLPIHLSKCPAKITQHGRWQNLRIGFNIVNQSVQPSLRCFIFKA
mmetsp:Transcript_88910/g.163286  ORF Transcript_88910/g.163286 Transcript_88910/m.163286 type:complete len:207 (-) Transcript_88910:161-781(-)